MFYLAVLEVRNLKSRLPAGDLGKLLTWLFQF
jgi:hypothetical protein